MNRRFIAITAGAYTSISATIFCRRWTIKEDGAAAINGLKLKFPEDGFTAVYTLTPSQEPYIREAPTAKGKGLSDLLGWPAQVNTQNTAVAPGTYPTTTPATVLVEVEAEVACNVWFEEYDT